MGRSKIVRPNFSQMNKEKAKNITLQFAEAIEEMSSQKEGLLIVIEREASSTTLPRQEPYWTRRYLRS